MASLSVVVIEPGIKSVGSLSVTGEDLVIGPLDLDGSVEPLHLPVLPWAVGSNGQVACADGGEGGLEVVGGAVVAGVVGDDLAHGEAVAEEEQRGPEHERGAGRSGLVVENLGVGQS
jgi:hypothetical protein